MPLLAVGGQTVVVPEEPTGPPSFRPDFIPETPYVTWTPIGGETRILACGDEARILAGVLGLDLPPDQQYESELTGGDGSILTGRRRLPRELIFPMHVRAKTLTEFEGRRRRLMADFDYARDGAFRWQLPDGTWRELRCRLSEMVREDGGHKGAQVVNTGTWRVTLRGVDPYWYGEEREYGWTAPGQQDFYGGGAGAPPYIISNANTLGSVTVNIDSEVQTWPEWGLRGPMLTATLAHPTNGTLELSPNLPIGRGMIIRTDERLQSFEKVLVGDVVDLGDGDWTLANTTLGWSLITDQFPTLWALEPGIQDITVTGTGTGPASVIRMRYRIRYLTA